MLVISCLNVQILTQNAAKLPGPTEGAYSHHIPLAFRRGKVKEGIIGEKGQEQAACWGHDSQQ